MDRTRALLDHARDRLQPALGDDGNWDRIATTLGALPDAPLVGLEARLAGGDPDVDAVLGFSPSDLAPWLDAFDPLPGGDPELDGRLLAFLRAESQRDPRTERVHEELWLEYDSSRTGRPVPSVFFSIRPRLFKTEARRWPHLPAHAARALETLWGGPGPEAVRAQLDRVFAHLPLDAWVYQVGAMVSRTPHGVRLVIRNVARDQAGPFLAALGLPDHPVLEWMARAGQLAPALPTHDLALDIGSRTSPRVGLELANRAAHPSWPAALLRTAMHGLAQPVRAEALMDWHGSRTLGARMEISHLKLVVQPDRPTELKAYFGFLAPTEVPA